MTFDLSQFEAAQLPASPLPVFADWYAAAKQAGLHNPDATALATANKEGAVSVRMVLLKSFAESGFTFFTNYESQKARELGENPQAAMVFYWDALLRQVRVSGSVARVSIPESQAYFQSRPRNAQIGAWVSQQSRALASRPALERSFAEAEQRFADQDPLPLPPHWGGFILVAQQIEFWQSRPDRLHDRFRYQRSGSQWQVSRLFP